MASHRKKVIAHAEESLDLEELEGMERPERLDAYKQFLKLENHRLRLEHGAGASGYDVAKKRSDLLDIVLERLFDDAFKAIIDSGEQAPIALVAVGGYGRGLLNPGSDIDLLFLTGRPTRSLLPATNDAIEQILYMLWDVGFKVGHSVRSIPEVIEQAKKDFQNFTAMIESRCLAGNQRLFEENEETFYKKCVVPLGDAYLKDRFQDRERRHNAAQTVYLQEPHMKEGQGGLREYHNVVWLTYVKLHDTDLQVLVRNGMLSETAHNEIEKAYDFLLTVRNHVHYAEKHPTDILTLRLQGVVATEMKYPERTILRRCESFMRDYYQHTSNLLMRCNEIYDRFKLQSRSNPRGMQRLGALARSLRGRKEFDGLHVENNRLYAVDTDIFDEDPSRLMLLFQHAQVLDIRMSPQLIDLVQANYATINNAFRYNKANRETFEAILTRKGSVAASLRQMHRVGFLGRYLPEFGALTCLVQHEFFHRYTADEHTLKTIDQLDELVGKDDPALDVYQKIFHHLEDPFVIYLALIMHDTGRAANMRHHEDASAILASKVCNRLKVSLPRRRMILFLVDHHLTLFRTATTKNIDDPEIIAGFGDIIGSKTNLDTLLLLTYADSKGTSDESWTGWKESLILQLYRNTRDYLKDRDGFQSAQIRAREELREAVEKKLGESYMEEVKAHFDGMPPRYFNFRSSTVVAAHIKLFRKFFKRLTGESDEDETLVPTLEWEPKQKSGWTSLRVATWNQSFLLARLSGALAANGISIVGADLFRRKDDLVLDLFRVCRPDYTPVENTTTFKAVEKTLAESVKVKTFAFQPLIKKALEAARSEGWDELSVPTRVVVRNDPNGRHTLVEIQAADRIGLLHDVFSAIAGLGNEVCHARINTEKGAAVDTMYIWDETGKPLSDPNRMTQLQETIHTLIT